jgi:hypothetical protein
MVMAASAVECDAHERFAGMFDGVVEPCVAIEDVPVANEIPGCSRGLQIIRTSFISRQHFDDHLIVRLVSVQ